MIEISDDVIVINIRSAKSRNTAAGKMLMHLLNELGRIFSIPEQSAIDCFLKSDGNSQMVFVNWLSKKYGIVATPYELKNDEMVHAFGYILEKNEGLTSAIMTFGFLE